MNTFNNFVSAKKDELHGIQILNTPDDTISDISIINDMVAISSWDGYIRIYKKIKTYTVNIEPFKIFNNLGAPVLSVCLINTMLCIAGLVDGNLCILNIQDGTDKKIKVHDGGIKNITLFKNEFIITVSFDGFYKIFDSNFKEVHQVNVGNKIYCMDQIDGHMVLGLSNKTIHYINLNNNEIHTFSTKFQYGIRSISCFPTNFGVEIAVGSVEGKIEIFNTKSANTMSSIGNNSTTIRLHRQDDKLYAINKIKWITPQSLITGGSDGYVYIINKNTKFKLATSKYDKPVTALDIKDKELILAIGDDWSKGFQQQYLKPELIMVDLNRLNIN